MLSLRRDTKTGVARLGLVVQGGLGQQLAGGGVDVRQRSEPRPTHAVGQRVAVEVRGGDWGRRCWRPRACSRLPRRGCRAVARAMNSGARCCRRAAPSSSSSRSRWRRWRWRLVKRRLASGGAPSSTGLAETPDAACARTVAVGVGQLLPVGELPTSPSTGM